MKENTNKALFINTIILYIQLAIRTICGFLTTRYSLQALGIVDYGLYSVIGSIITFIAIVNTIMVSSSHRYIAVAIGKGDLNECNRQFNVCMVIHLVIAVATFLIAFIVGSWYIEHYVNYDGNISIAHIVFNFSLIASVFSFAGVPFHGLLMAKEKFLLFSLPEIFSSIVRLGLSIMLVYYFDNKLIIYASYMAFFTMLPTIVYILYSKKNFKEIIKFKIVKEGRYYREILGFSAWVGYGAVAYVGKAQGAAILVNAFFNTIMNTALGVANAINSIIGMFAKSIAQPIDPQITKNYASGNYERCESLLIASIKYTFLAMFLISSPILLEPQWVLKLWLGKVPPFAVQFTILVIIDALLDALNSGVKSIIFASGNIKLFQIIPSTIKLFTILVAYFVLKTGVEAYYLFFVYILSTLIVVIVNQWILSVSVNVNNKNVFVKSLVPSVSVVLLFIPYFFSPFTNPIINILIGLLYLLAIIIFVGLGKEEREKLYYIVKVKIFKK